MAKKRVNQGRRVVSPLQSSDAEYTGPSSQQMKDELDFYGRKRAQLVDISSQMESIFTLQQDQTREADRQFGLEKQLLNNLGVYENKTKLIAMQKKLVRDLSLEDSNIIKQTISDYEDYNREAANVTKRTQELLRFRKEQLPFEDKIRGFQAEIAALQADGVKNLTAANKEKLKDLTTLEKQYQALSKQEQMNQRIEKIQQSISDIMFDQGTAAGQIFDTMKKIVTNPLVIFTGLLALGVQRYEEMRQRTNQLVEEQDRVNKALAGAGPYQDKIIEKARRITHQFKAAGEGFSSSFENAAASVGALESQLGNVDFITGKLVDQMAKLKLSIGLSDEESAKVLDNFMLMNGLSEEAAINASNLTYHMSETMGLNPAVVFQDIASASGETLAHFSGGAREIAKAAVEARRMGLTLQDVANISKGLLDFETSIEAEMEAQMLTGRQLNFNRARMFAMNKQGGKAAEEVMRQVGGLERFQKMNIFQQEAIAKATGLSVDQLLKTNAQRERENNLARDKERLIGKQLDMSIEVTKMMGKLDVGLTIMQEIAKTLGDIFLDVFMPGMQQGEKTLLQFIKGDKFKNAVTSILKMVKSVINGIADVFRMIADSPVGRGIGNYFSGGTGGIMSGFSGPRSKELADSRTAGAFKLALGSYALFKLGTFVNPMIVKDVGAGNLLTKLFGGSGGKFYKGGQFMPGGGRAMAGGQFAGGRKLLGMNLGRGLGGASGATGTALGGTALGTAGAVLGGAGVVGSIGMGIYDVATLSDRATGRERATAYGGLGGAVGGAASGALIGSAVPVIGTLLGAGIGGILGYFGGRAVGAMDVFRDDLDTARDAAKEASEKREEVLSAAQAKFELDAMKGSMQVGKAFRNLSGGMKELTGDKMKEFGDLLIEQGVLGRDAFKQFAADGKITMEELQKIQSSVSQNIIALGNQQINEVIETVDENIEYEELPMQQKVVDILNTLLQQDMGKKAIAQLDLTQSVPYYPSNPDSAYFDQTRGNINTEELNRFIIAQTGITDLTQRELKAMLDAYNQAMGIFEEGDGAFIMPETLNDGLQAAIGVLLDKREAELLNLSAQRDDDIVDGIQNLNNNGDGIDLSTDSINDLGDLYKTTNGVLLNNFDTSYLDSLMNQNIPGVNTRDVGVQFAGGGVLYGPSHSQGGIPTKYGELEGGEAVINRNSTRMFAGLLSQINAAGGGASFATGGLLGLGPHTAGMKHKGGLVAHLAEAGIMTGLKKGQFYGSNLADAKEGGDPIAKALSGASTTLTGLEVAAAVTSKILPAASTSATAWIANTIGRVAMPVGIGLLLGQMFYSNYLGRFDKAQKTLANYGGYDQFEARTLVNDMRNAEDPRERIGNDGRTYYRDGPNGKGSMEKPSEYWDDWFKNAGIPDGQNTFTVYDGIHQGYGYSNKYFPLDLTTYLSRNIGEYSIGAAGAEPIPAGPQRLGLLGTMIEWAREGGATLYGAPFNRTRHDYVDPNDQTRLYALGAGPKDQGYGYVDPYGLGPIKNKTGYAIKKLEYGFPGGITKWKEHFPRGGSLGTQRGGFEATTPGYGGKEYVKRQDISNTRYETEHKKLENYEFGRGGVIANSPITKVNDMILTKDGQMIETHQDDTLIAKKGDITQKSGGKSRVEELLMELIEVTRAGGDVYMDGSKVSAAVSRANYIG